MLVALLLLFIAANTTCGQWKIVAPSIVGTIQPYSAGVIYFNHGVLLVGYQDLYESHDTGVTWSKMNLNLNGAHIRDVKFYDQNIGIVAAEDGGTVNGGVYLTTDGGGSWAHILAITYCWALDFMETPNDIVVCQNYGGQLFTSHDMGKAWKSKTLNDYGLDIHSIGVGSAICFYGNYTTRLGRLFLTTDFGDSWTPRGDSIDFDSYTFAVDSTDHSKIYLGNEEFGAPKLDGISGIFETTNSGLNWRALVSFVAPALVSSVVAAPHGIFYQTSILDPGGSIFRLFPCDASSVPIGGPPANGDCRLLSAINDSVLVAVDPSGNVWRTTDCGGFPVRSDVNRPLALVTADEKTDTLGATVGVPITINGLERPEDVDLVLHYDGSVDYLGSFSPLGAQLDVAGEAWPGRSKIHIAGAAPGIVAGYAKFNAWNDSNTDAHATFDSMSVLTAISPCEYGLPEAARSTISAPSGCAIPKLSQWVHRGEEPKFVVRPNPTSSDVTISSSLDLGAVTIAIYDMLGAERSRLEKNIRGGTPVTLPLPDADGVYTVVLRTAAGMYDLRVIRHR